jgi:hypothetical protein
VSDDYVYGFWRESYFKSGIARHRVTKRGRKYVYFLRRFDRLDSNGVYIGPDPLEEWIAANSSTGKTDSVVLTPKGSYSKRRRRIFPTVAALQAWVSRDAWRAEEHAKGIVSRNKHPQRSAADLATLKAAAVAAHPDKGGSAEAFTAAWAKYENVANFESLTFAKKLGVDIPRLVEALGHGSGANWSLSRWGKSTGKWAEKDMDVALELAQRALMPMPLAGLVDQLVKQLNQDKMKALLS